MELLSDPRARNAEVLNAEMQAMVEDPSIKKLVDQLAEPINEMLSDEALRDQAQAAVEQVQAVIADPKFQKQAKRFSKPIQSLMAAGEQMQHMMQDPSLQQYA